MSHNQKLAVIVGVYVIEGYPMGVFRDVWPVYFRDHGATLAMIGDISALYVLWSLKFLWSPLVDRFGERRRWIAGALLAMAVVHLGLATQDPTQITGLLWFLLILFCAASATQDIAIDAYTIGFIDRGEEGAANGARITAYRVGLVMAGGGLVVLPDIVGWPNTWRLTALASVLMAAAVFLAPRIEVPVAARRELWAPLGRWLSKPGAAGVLAFVLLYRVGDLAMGPMVKPFWVDRGFSHAEIGFFSTTLGAGATVAGALVGAGLVTRWGIPDALVRLGLLALLSNLAYAGAAALPAAGSMPVYAASLVESFCAGLASAAFLSFLMRICQKQHAAVQYAGLTALYALPGSLSAVASGRAVEALGYSTYFALTALVALPAFALIPAARRWSDALPGDLASEEASRDQA